MISIGLAGCGLQVPDMGAFGETPLEEAFTEMDLVNHIKCEIHLGVRDALNVWKKGGPAGGNGVDWLKAWDAKVNLSLTVDDTTSVNPGVSLTRPMNNVISHFVDGGDVTSPQSFAMGLGLQASAQSTRIEILAFTFHVADLLKYDPLRDDETSCNGHGRVSVLGTLKINEFIVSKSGMAASPDTVPNNGVISPFTAFNDEVTFIVTFGGDATPQWTLVRVTANSTSPFLNAVRKRTQDVTVTMGPRGSNEVAAIYQASLTGQAVAAALQTRR